MTTLRRQLEALLDAVLHTEPDEIDCDGFLKGASALLEALAEDGGELPEDLAAVSRHLSVCPECREEFEALIRVVES